MKAKWQKFGYGFTNWETREGNWPSRMLPRLKKIERKYVLVRIRPEKESLPVGVAVGYLKFAAGDPRSPNFIVPGIGHLDGMITHYCDCLGADFEYPNKDVV
jgi:hypothetical protein